MKACLPDMISTRIDDILNAQTVDEEIVAHMRELSGQLEALRALAREDAFETAASLAEDVLSLCSRIRRDFVAMAYRQGLQDGGRLREVFSTAPADAGQPTDTP